MTTPNTRRRRHIAEIPGQGADLPAEQENPLSTPERREYELVYAGKQREEDILTQTVAAALQPVKTFFTRGRNVDWCNMLILGDNLQAMQSLLRWKETGRLANADHSPGVRLIYIDPPFATRQEYRNTQEERAYRDWLSGAGYIEFLRQRLVLAKHLLANNGSIYVHLDANKSHYIKVIMDEIFGESCFQREIIWRIGWLSGFKTQARNWIRNHDVILFYTKSANFIFNKLYIPYPEGYTRRDGSPPKGAGYPLEDTWNCYEIDRLDSIQIMSYSGEKTGFPTQKNEKLLARIIRASSNPGDIVLDAFAGSGTTLAVAEKLGRRWIGIDCGKLAIYTIQKRLLTLKKEIGNRGDPLTPNPFILYNASLDDLSRLERLPWEEWRCFALHLFQCRDEPHVVGRMQMDGYLGAGDVLVFNHLRDGGAVLDHGFIDALHEQSGGRLSARVFIIAPATRVTFMEDYSARGQTRYYILRVPGSIINELANLDWQAGRSWNAKKARRMAEAVGYDFIHLPEVQCEYLIRTGEGEPGGATAAVIRIQTFQSKATVKGAAPKGNRETLAMVMVDYDYNGRTFTLDAVFYADKIKKEGWEVRLPPASLSGRLMLIYVDIYGNEYREIKKPGDFQPSDR